MMAGPGEKPLPESQEPFLSRWSRLKDEARQAPADPAPVKATEEPGPAPALPSLDDITPETDFRPFFHPKVGEEVRRAALKKLFSDPHFNVMDGLDVYIDDYSKTEPIPEAMMQGLRQAQMILASAREDAEERERKKRAEAAPPQSLEAPVAAPGAEAGTPADMERPVTNPAGVAGGAGDGTKA